MTKIFAVILTYNRKDLLKICLDAVCSQTRPCDHIIVIDNASSDGTQEMLSEYYCPGLIVSVLRNNIGAAGGYNAGLRLAYQKGADFIWAMDDDVIPEKNALHYLMSANEVLQKKGKKAAFFISKALTETGLLTNTPAISTLKNHIGYRDWPEILELGMVAVQRATFVSILLPRSTLSQHGLPIASMFIWGEDNEFTLRITQEFPGYFVGKSKVQHLRQEDGPISILTEGNPVRLELHRHYIRNKIFISRKYRHFPHNLHYVSQVYRSFRLFCNLLIKGEFKKANIVMRGVLESVWFFPESEAANTPINKMKTSMWLSDHQGTKEVNMVEKEQNEASFKMGQ